MNTKETTGETKNDYEGDKLDRIFAAQGDLMKNYKAIAEAHYSKIFRTPVKFSDEVWAGGEQNLHTKEGSYLIRDMINAAAQELNEAIQTNKNWKAWKADEIMTDVDHFKEEMVDALHFYVEALLFAGVSAEELFTLYFKKNEVNHFRQKSNY